MFFPQVAMTEGATIHPMMWLGPPTNGRHIDTTVTARNVNSHGFTFVTDPSHHFFDGTVDFRVAPAPNGSITFSINVQANWTWLYSSLMPWGDLLQSVVLMDENVAWNNLIDQMQKKCSQ